MDEGVLSMALAAMIAEELIEVATFFFPFDFRAYVRLTTSLLTREVGLGGGIDVTQREKAEDEHGVGSKSKAEDEPIGELLAKAIGLAQESRPAQGRDFPGAGDQNHVTIDRLPRSYTNKTSKCCDYELLQMDCHMIR